MTLTPSDLATITERITGRLRHEGTAALATARSWADTIKAASYGDDKGTNRWEIDPTSGQLVPVPHDPTGDQAVDPDEVAQMHGRLLKLMHQARSVIAEMENIFDQVSPDPSKHPKKLDDKLDDDRWCRSCKADRGRLEPVAVHSDGRIKYRGECRWCHDVKADFGRYPTPELIRKHHTPYVYVTESDYAAAFGHRRKAG